MVHRRIPICTAEQGRRQAVVAHPGCRGGEIQPLRCPIVVCNIFHDRICALLLGFLGQLLCGGRYCKLILQVICLNYQVQARYQIFWVCMRPCMAYEKRKGSGVRLAVLDLFERLVYVSLRSFSWYMYCTSKENLSPGRTFLVQSLKRTKRICLVRQMQCVVGKKCMIALLRNHNRAGTGKFRTKIPFFRGSYPSSCPGSCQSKLRQYFCRCKSVRCHLDSDRGSHVFPRTINDIASQKPPADLSPV